ncbi:MAG: sporulation protein YtfJ [Oscillospiraceae bacterium]|nr:sporulation protein YtfJ [Oscillospiraceae bacterium]
MMSHPLPNMVENTLAKIKEMIDANTVVGSPITTTEGVTILPISKISIGFAGGGSDFVSKNANKFDNPFGGGTGAGVNITPVAFLVIREDSVRMLPIAAPVSNTADRVVEMIPDVLDKISAFIDSKKPSESGNME